MWELKKDYDRYGDEIWCRFNQKDKNMQGWYYREIAEILDDHYFEDDVLFREFSDMVYSVFGYGKDISE